MIGFVLLSLWALVALPVIHGNDQFGAVAGFVMLMNLSVFGFLLLLFLTRRLSIGMRIGLLGERRLTLDDFTNLSAQIPYRRGLSITLLFIR